MSAGKVICSDVEGYRSLLSHLVVSLVQDLAILRRAGMWHNHPREMASLCQSGKGWWSKLPAQVRGAYQAGMWQDWYLSTVCAMSQNLCGVEVTPDRLITAAKRMKSISRERQYNSHSNPRQRAKNA